MNDHDHDSDGGGCALVFIAAVWLLALGTLIYLAVGA